MGSQVNWRIYDNIGGFSTVQNLSSANSILVVSDYALGQKFAATTFAGRNSNLNLVPKLFGAESYLTDVDVSTLPDVLYAGLAVGTVTPPSHGARTAVTSTSRRCTTGRRSMATFSAHRSRPRTGWESAPTTMGSLTTASAATERPTCRPSGTPSGAPWRAAP